MLRLQTNMKMNSMSNSALSRKKTINQSQLGQSKKFNLKGNTLYDFNDGNSASKRKELNLMKKAHKDANF